MAKGIKHNNNSEQRKKKKKQSKSKKSIELLNLDDRYNMVKVEVIGRGTTFEVYKEFGIFLGKKSDPQRIVLEYCPTNLKKSVKN